MTNNFIMIDADELVVIFTSEKVPLITKAGKRGLIYDKHDENRVIVHPGNLDNIKEEFFKDGVEFLVAGKAKFPFEDYYDCPSRRP